MHFDPTTDRIRYAAAVIRFAPPSPRQGSGPGLSPVGTGKKKAGCKPRLVIVQSALFRIDYGVWYPAALA
jgi:hypothetical protein